MSLRAAAILVVLATSSSLIAAGALDLSQGQIRGMASIGVLPGDGSAAGDPAGFEAVFVRRDDPGVSLRVPAGQWSLPPTGDYRIFLEGKHVVSGAPTNLQWTVARFEGKGIALVKQYVPAGVVRVDGSCANDSCRGWLLHETSNVQTPIPNFSPEMLREPSLSEARQPGVLMPTGRVIAAIYDVKNKPNGAPAARAEIMVDINRPKPWIVRTDEQGRAEIPAEAANAVIAIHANGAALLARRWPGSAQQWTLDPPAPRDLVLRAVRNGTDVNYFARVLWLDGVRLAGLPLSWLFRESLPAPGRWAVRNLPARPVSVLLYRYKEGSAVAAGLFDSMRKDVAYPWPALVDVEVLE